MAEPNTEPARRLVTQLLSCPPQGLRWASRWRHLSGYRPGRSSLIILPGRQGTDGRGILVYARSAVEAPYSGPLRGRGLPSERLARMVEGTRAFIRVSPASWRALERAQQSSLPAETARIITLW